MAMVMTAITKIHLIKFESRSAPGVCGLAPSVCGLDGEVGNWPLIKLSGVSVLFAVSVLCVKMPSVKVPSGVFVFSAKVLSGLFVLSGVSVLSGVLVA